MIEINELFEKYPIFFRNRCLNDLKSVKNFIFPNSNYVKNPFEFYQMEKAVSIIISYDKKFPIFIHCLLYTSDAADE